MAKAILGTERGLVHTLHGEETDKGLVLTHQYTQDIEPFLKAAETARNENAGYWNNGKVRELVHLCDVPLVVALDIKQQTGFDMWKVNLDDPAVKVELFTIMKRLGYDGLFMKKNLA